MDPLDAVRRLVTASDREGAKRALGSILRADPQNASAWAMLAPLLQDPTQQADCYRQILRLDPDNGEAAARLRALAGRPPQASPRDQSASSSPSQATRWATLISLSKPSPPQEPLTPEDVIRLAGGALPPAERQNCPKCDAVTSRDAAKCPWCGAPLSGQ